MTNDFRQVTVQQLVSVKTNATVGLDVSWVTDLPGVSNGWTYVYTVTRTPQDGTAEELAAGLSTAAYTDSAAVTGTFYRYAVTAVPVPRDGLDSPPSVLLGTSAYTRLPYAVTNLMSGVPQGLFAAYYSPTGAPLPVVTRTEDSVTNAAVAMVAGTNMNYRTVYNASIQVDASDAYTFLIESDDGLQLWVGDDLVIDNGFAGNYEGSSMPVWLEAGRRYPVRMEYFQNTGSRVCTLAWRRAGVPDVTVTVPALAFSPVPLPWRHEDIGDVKLNGNASFDIGTGAVTVTANGNALTNGADACHLITRDAEGDFDLTVRLDSLTGTGTDRLAGLIARGDLTPGSAGVALLAVPGTSSYALSVVTRAVAGAAPALTTIDTGVAISAPLWLRASGNGQSIRFSYRADDVTAWTSAGHAERTFATACKIGLATSSAGDAGAATAVFSGLLSADYPSTVLNNTQDAYVRSDGLNYGTDVLYVKRSTGTTQREVFLRFGVAGQAGLRSALLRLYMQGRDATPAVQQVVVRSFTDLDWNEMTATWTNAPGGMRLPTIFLSDDDPMIVTRKILPAAASGAQYVEFDVTSAVRAAAEGTGDLTLHLYNTEILPNGSISFASKEHSSAACRPTLVCTYDAPQGVAADGGPDTANVTVSWRAYTGAGAYRLYRADSADGAYARVGGELTATCFKDAGLAAGQRYFYKVSAVIADGETPLSAAVWADAAEIGSVAYADEDAHVEGNGSIRNSADVNYGTATSLTLKYNAADQCYHREAYLLFNDIAGMAHVARAVLRVMPSTADGGGILPSQIPVQFIRMPSNDWNEATVTFNNHPGDYPPPTPRLYNEAAKDRVTLLAQAANTVMEVDVTDMLREAALVNADHKLSIGVLRVDDLGGFNLFLYSSEQTVAASKPQLVYAMGRPMAPQAVASNGYVQLRWPPYRGATGYVIRRADASGGTYAVVANTAETTVKDLAAEAGKTYFYSLAAVTAGGETEASLATPAQVQAPVEERYPVADAYIESNGGSTETVNHGRDPTFNLKRSPVREDFFKFDVTGLENASAVRFRVCSSAQSAGYLPVNIIVRAGDFGDWNEFGVTYSTPPPTYTPPSVSTAEKGANEQARVYCAYKDPGSYDNYIEADVTAAVRAAAQAGQRCLTLFLTGDDLLQNGNGAMNIPSREYGTILKRPVLLCSGSRFGAPQGLQAEALAEGPGFTLTWRTVTGADHYVIVRQGPTDEAPVVLSDNVTGTTFTDVDAAFWNDLDYTYTVTAVNADGTVSEGEAVTAALVRTFTRPVLADTYVRDGTYTNASFAQTPQVEIKGDSNVGYQREGFFRIAATNLPTFAKAHLRLNVAANTNPDITVVVQAVTDTGWMETGSAVPTWNSILGAGAARSSDPGAEDASVMDRFTPAERGYAVGDNAWIDITRWLKAAQAQTADTLMVHVFVTTPGGENMFNVHSIQAADLENIPFVRYTVAKNPAPGTRISVR